MGPALNPRIARRGEAREYPLKDAENNNGYRIPALFASNANDENKIILGFRMMIDSDQNYGRSETNFEVEKSKWINIQLSQTNGLYEIEIDNKIVHSIVNSNPRQWEDVNFTLCKKYPYSENCALGQYRNLKVKLCQSELTRKGL